MDLHSTYFKISSKIFPKLKESLHEISIVFSQLRGLNEQTERQINRNFK